nr:unnamed protein product [Callosobruchus chinensis]
MSEVTGISRTSIQRILKHYKWHPYKIQLLQELNEDDNDRRTCALRSRNDSTLVSPNRRSLSGKSANSIPENVGIDDPEGTLGVGGTPVGFTRIVPSTNGANPKTKL